MSFKDWKKCKLDDLIEKRNQGVNTTTEKVKYSEKGIPVIRAQNISSSGLSFDDIVYVSSETFARVREECKPVKNNVLYTNIGSQFGTACVVDVDYPFLIAWNVLRIQTKKGTNPSFLKYVLNNPEIKSMIRGMNSSSTMPFVSGKEIGNIDLLVPEFFIQTRIALTLSALDDKIDLNRQTNQTLEAMAQAVYKEWFVNFNFPGATGEMQDSELGPIPKRWRVGEYTNELNIVYGKNLPTVNLLPSGYPVFGGNGLIGFFDKYLYEDPQVIVACRGAASGKVNQSLPNSFVTNNSLIFEIPQKSKLKFTYLKQYCLNTDFTSFVSGSAQPQLTIESFKNAFLLIPEEQILKNFDKLILPAEEAIRENDIQSNCLIQIRDSLLPKLMNGEIEL